MWKLQLGNRFRDIKRGTCFANRRGELEAEGFDVSTHPELKHTARQRYPIQVVKAAYEAYKVRPSIHAPSLQAPELAPLTCSSSPIPPYLVGFTSPSRATHTVCAALRVVLCRVVLCGATGPARGHAGPDEVHHPAGRQELPAGHLGHAPGRHDHDHPQRPLHEGYLSHILSFPVYLLSPTSRP